MGKTEHIKRKTPRSGLSNKQWKVHKRENRKMRRVCTERIIRALQEYDDAVATGNRARARKFVRIIDVINDKIDIACPNFPSPGAKKKAP